MENNSEQKSSSLSEQEEKLWDFYLSVGVQGADELRKELGLDELNFRSLAPNLNREPKKYFLYRILDEIQKASLKIAYWKEYLSEEEPDKLQRIDYEILAAAFDECNRFGVKTKHTTENWLNTFPFRLSLGK